METFEDIRVFRMLSVGALPSWSPAEIASAMKVDLPPRDCGLRSIGGIEGAV